MTTQFTVDARKLLALFPHLSTRSDQPILRCVFFEAGGVAVATDGITLLAYVNAHTAPQDTLIEWPKDTVQLVKKAAKAEEKLTVRVEGSTAVVEYGGAVLPVIHQDDFYPRWRYVIPSGEPKAITYIGLTPDLGKRFPEAVRLWFYGEERVVVVESETDAEMLGLWMPRTGRGMRRGMTEPNPHWPELPHFPKQTQEVAA